MISGIRDFKNFFNYNQDGKHIKTYFPPFYKQLIENWFTLFSTEPTNPCQILNEKLWQNKFILVNNKPLLYNQWIQAGIIFLYDILNENCKDIDELGHKYHANIDIMKYNSLKSAIPQKWLNCIQPEHLNS